MPASGVANGACLTGAIVRYGMKRYIAAKHFKAFLHSITLLALIYDAAGLTVAEEMHTAQLRSKQSIETEYSRCQIMQKYILT